MEKLYKNLLSIVAIILFTISFNACGGGGDNAHFSNTEQKIPIDANCTTPATIDSYISIFSGDVLVSTETNTTIETYHNENGTKKVCIISGSAYIIRK